jgi:tetratricopeptide (TPR) repeat protein
MGPVYIPGGSFLFRLLQSIYRAIIGKFERRKHYYRVIWKKPSKIKPKDLDEFRGRTKHGFSKRYLNRPHDKKIRKSIQGGRDVLVLGEPLAGKTRAVYEAIRSLDNSYDILIPRLVDIEFDNFFVPWRVTFWRKRIVIFDDINKFTEKRDFEHLLSRFSDDGIIVLATCRTGDEYKKFCNKTEGINFPIIRCQVQIPKMDKEEGKEAAKQLERELPATFNGTMGSILLDIGTMRNRYGACTPLQKGILRSLKRLYYAGLYRERQVFPLEWVKRTCLAREDIDLKEYDWQEIVHQIKAKGFLDLRNMSVQVDEVYLDDVIECQFSLLNDFIDMLSIFSNDPEALYLLGNRADDIAQASMERANLEKIAIAAFIKALETWKYETNPEDYAKTQHSLGIAYVTLAEMENTAENCRKAIAACREALKVHTLDHFPMQYAAANNNLGNAYQTLAVVEDTAENCRKAITACREALKVRTLDRFPIQYAATNNNLGIAYGVLAGVEDRAENCRKAIAACTEALKVYTLDRFPMQYATTNTNLGAAYQTLGGVEDRAENCRMAIVTYGEALKVHTLDPFPVQYATTNNNLSNAYRTLAEVEDKVENCKKAIAACREALKVRTLDRFPIQYATTNDNLGIAYGTLAEMEDTAENCKKAIAAYGEALKVHTLDHFPMQYATANNNLGIAYVTLSQVEDRTENCKKAIAACREALKVRTLDRFPMDYAMTKANLGIIYIQFAQTESQESDIEEARKAIIEALKGFEIGGLPSEAEEMKKILEKLGGFRDKVTEKK